MFCYVFILSSNEIIEKIDIIYEFDYNQKAIKMLSQKKSKCILFRVNLSRNCKTMEVSLQLPFMSNSIRKILYVCETRVIFSNLYAVKLTSFPWYIYNCKRAHLVCFFFSYDFICYYFCVFFLSFTIKCVE